LSREPRSATVIAVRATDLLILDADDFLHLVDRLPDIGTKVQAVARQRTVTPQ
jgi:CRP-like cAMP-binding protein